MGGSVSRQETPFGWVVWNYFPSGKAVWLGCNVFVFRQENCLIGIVTYLFSVRKTVGAYRIRPEVREESTASLVDAAVGFRFRPCGGRMRYAPTPVRLNTLLDGVVR